MCLCSSWTHLGLFPELGWVGGNRRTQWKSENRLQYKITKDRRYPNVASELWALHPFTGSHVERHGNYQELRTFRAGTNSLRFDAYSYYHCYNSYYSWIWCHYLKALQLEALLPPYPPPPPQMSQSTDVSKHTSINHISINQLFNKKI